MKGNEAAFLKYMLLSHKMPASILLPATRFGFRAKRSFFPIADNANPGFFDSPIHQIILDGLGTPFPQFQVVLHRPAFIAMAFNQHAGVFISTPEEFKIFLQHGYGIRTNRIFIKIKKDIGQT